MIAWLPLLNTTKNIMKVIIVSGGFDPIHSGHIAYFNSAKELGDKLVVALNSDGWLINKKGNFFQRGYRFINACFRYLHTKSKSN